MNLKDAQCRCSGPMFFPAQPCAAVQVRLIWGLKGMDYSGKALWDATDLGALAFDDAFDPSSDEAQVFLLRARPPRRARALPCQTLHLMRRYVCYNSRRPGPAYFCPATRRAVRWRPCLV